MAGTPLIKEGKRRRWGRSGQIVIPAAFIFPSLFLFVYLIYETSRLSGEKIKHQFALDAAVFVEMTNYSDFLNRTAYVNGAFPMRIFDEGFYTQIIDCEGKSAKCPTNTDDKRLWEILYRNGDFPRAEGRRGLTGVDLTGVDSWKILFGGPDADDKNQNPPHLKDTIEIITMDNANTFWINWDDANQIYKLYVQIYQLLGSVEDAQWSVLKRLADGHNFLTKSYYLNTGEPAGSGGGAAALFGSQMGNWGGGIVQPHCYEKMMFYGNKPTGSYLQPYVVYAPESPIKLPNTISGCTGLFHLMTVKQSTVDMLKGPFGGGTLTGTYGFGVQQTWKAPSNYFSHNFNNQFDGDSPKVHVTVGLGSKGTVWPEPTPKFQVRTYP